MYYNVKKICWLKVPLVPALLSQDQIEFAVIKADFGVESFVSSLIKWTYILFSKALCNH